MVGKRMKNAVILKDVKRKKRWSFGIFMIKTAT